jgi:hypothetical protein
LHHTGNQKTVEKRVPLQRKMEMNKKALEKGGYQKGKNKEDQLNNVKPCTNSAPLTFYMVRFWL